MISFENSQSAERGVNSLFAFGGPKGLKSNQKSQNLLTRIISDGNFLHSCLAYNGHLQTIRDIAQGEKLKAKIIVKCYLNYSIAAMFQPEAGSPRRDSLVKQIIEVRELFRRAEVEIVPQISSICYVPKNGYKEFISYIHNELGIKRVLIEIFPSGRINALDFATKIKEGIFNAGLMNSMKLGLTSYENKDTYGFDPVIAEFISRNNLEISPMRILGDIHSKMDLKGAFERLSLCTNYVNFFRGITQVSTDQQYDELNEHARYLFKKRQFQDLSLQWESFKPQERILAVNPYGLRYRHSIYSLIKSSRNCLKLLFVAIRSRKFEALKKLMPQGLM